MNGEKEVVALVQSALYAYALLACANPRRRLRTGRPKNHILLSINIILRGQKVTATLLMDLCEVDVQREGWYMLTLCSILRKVKITNINDVPKPSFYL